MSGPDRALVSVVVAAVVVLVVAATVMAVTSGSGDDVASPGPATTAGAAPGADEPAGRRPGPVMSPGAAGCDPTDEVAADVVAPDQPRLATCALMVLAGDEVVGVSADASRVTWRMPCPGASWASPVAGLGPTFEVAVCDGEYVGLDGQVGTPLWRRPVEGRPSRVRVGARAFLVQEDGVGVTVLDLVNGEEFFRLTLGEPANVTADLRNVYIATDLGIEAYSLPDGDHVWNAPVPASGLIATESAVYARTNDHDVQVLDPATGEVLHAAGVRRPAELSWSDFMLADHRAVVLRATEGARDVSVYDAVDASLLWSIPGVAAVSGRDGWVAVVDFGGRLSVHDVLTGEEVAVVEGVERTAPTVADGAVVFVRDGVIERLELG